jgi:hypothetical protein
MQITSDSGFEQAGYPQENGERIDELMMKGREES